MLKSEIQNKLNKINTLVGERWPVSGISYGVATNLESESAHHCLSLADSRMYQLKSQHKASAAKPVSV